MTSEEIVRLVVSFLGGGTVAGVLNWLRLSISEKQNRRATYVAEQLKNLYGPLFFLSSQNQEMFKLNAAFHDAYSEEYLGKKYSSCPSTQRNLAADTSITIDIANRYVKVVKENNDQIFKLLMDNYSFMEPIDGEQFNKFVVDYIRMKAEIDTIGKLETPLLIYKRVGDISFMRPEFIDCVNRRFHEKKKELSAVHQFRL